MKKIFKIFLTLAIAVCIFPTSTFAIETENSRENNPMEITPYWWPGNPNPQPGTEDWFFQNPSYGSSAPDPVAKQCGYDAIVDALLPSAVEEAFMNWYLKKQFDIYTFGLSFAVNVTYNYAVCLWRSGVR